MKRLAIFFAIALASFHLYAQPVIEGTATYEATAAANTHPVDLPASIQSGELGIIQFVLNGAGRTVSATGWTVRDDVENAVNPQLVTLVRDLDGGEGASISVSFTGDPEVAAAWSARISGALADSSQPPEFATAATGNSTAPDPPNIAATDLTGEPKDFLFLDFAGSVGTSTPTTNGDTDFVGLETAFDGGDISLFKAHNAATAASSYDPAAFGQSNPTTWVAQTVAVHPAAAGGGNTSLRRRRN